eukprot:15352781-Ditylum_brightwellii.AAC.1
MVINVIKLIHELLSAHLTLDAFSAIMQGLNDSTGTVASNIGHTATHTLNKLLNNIVPNVSYKYYTQCFVRALVCLGEPPVKEPMPRNISENLLFGSQCQNAYDLLGKLHKGSFE